MIIKNIKHKELNEKEVRKLQRKQAEGETERHHNIIVELRKSRKK